MDFKTVLSSLVKLTSNQLFSSWKLLNKLTTTNLPGVTVVGSWGHRPAATGAKNRIYFPCVSVHQTDYHCDITDLFIEDNEPPVRADLSRPNLDCDHPSALLAEATVGCG